MVHAPRALPAAVGRMLLALLFLLACAANAHAAGVLVHGKAVDADDQPLAGVILEARAARMSRPAPATSTTGHRSAPKCWAGAR